MADQPTQDLHLPNQDAGAAFRLEMWATNALIGYWWVLVAAIVAVLAAVAVYGWWDSTWTSAQRTTSAETATAFRKAEAALIDDRKLTEFLQQRGLRIQVTPSFDDYKAGYPPVIHLPLEAALVEFGSEGADKVSALTASADELLAIHARGSGPAAAQSALLAAELYRLAGSTDGQRKAYEAARGAAGAPQRFAADAGLARLALASGDVDGAAAFWRPWIDERNGFFGQLAALDLARAYRSHDRPGDAKATLDELDQKWPASTLVDQITVEREALGMAAGQGSAPAEAPLPTPALAPTEGG